MKELIGILQTISNLKKIKRKGWLVKKIKNPESVADHTTLMALMAMLWAKKYQVDELKLIKMALLHDLAEAEISDDIGRHDGIGPEKKHQMEEEAMKRLCSRFPEGKEWFEIWKEAEQLKTKEAKLVKQFDGLDLVIQALEYEKQVDDPREMDEFWLDAKSRIGHQELRPLFDELCQLRKKRK